MPHKSLAEVVVCGARVIDGVRRWLDDAAVVADVGDVVDSEQLHPSSAINVSQNRRDCISPHRCCDKALLFTPRRCAGSRRRRLWARGAGGHELAARWKPTSSSRCPRSRIDATPHQLPRTTKRTPPAQPLLPMFPPPPPAFIRGAPSAAVHVRCAVSHARRRLAPARHSGRRRRAARPLLLRRNAQAAESRRQFREHRAELDGRGAASDRGGRRRRAAVVGDSACRTSRTRRGGRGARPSCPI